ncbi:MAG: ATP-binding protein [Burkholderiaceae bacterium]|nr:ATP-binding protein [Burkholderiaceae bacterium]
MSDPGRLAGMPGWRVWALVVAFAAAGLAIDVGISRAIERESHAYLLRQLGAIARLSGDLLRAVPEAERAAAVQEVDARFAFPVRLEETVPGERAGADADGLRWREPLDPAHTLVLGPVTLEDNPEYRGPMRRLHALRVASAALFALLAAGLAIGWMRPVQRDLRRLRDAAAAIAQRRWSTRVGAARSEPITPLNEAFDAMATRIEALLERSRVLAAAIGHELRTPLARIRFAVDALRDEPPTEAALAAIEGDLDELEALIDASLTWSRLEREDIRFEPGVEDLAPWLERQVGHLRPIAGERALSCTADGPLRARFDPSLLAYAVRNGVRNALKYARSTVRVGAAVRHDRVEVTIDDDGPGVDPAQREAVFEPFRRLARDDDARHAGWGLGLAVVRRTMTLHGGEARIEDSPLGGARLVLFLPRPPG